MTREQAIKRVCTMALQLSGEVNYERKSVAIADADALRILTGLECSVERVDMGRGYTAFIINTTKQIKP